MSTVAAFAGNAVFLAAALLAVNAGKIKDIFDPEVEKPGGKEVKKVVKNKHSMSEALIENLVKERFFEVNPRPSIVEDFKTKMRTLFKLPPMQEVIAKLTSSMKKQSKTNKVNNLPAWALKFYPDSAYINLKTREANRLKESQSSNRKPPSQIPYVGPPIHIHKHIKPPQKIQDQNIPSSDGGYRYHHHEVSQ